jgi:hypothetical protein
MPRLDPGVAGNYDEGHHVYNIQGAERGVSAYRNLDQIPSTAWRTVVQLLNSVFHFYIPIQGADSQTYWVNRYQLINVLQMPKEQSSSIDLTHTEGNSEIVRISVAFKQAHPNSSTLLREASSDSLSSYGSISSPPRSPTPTKAERVAREHATRFENELLEVTFETVTRAPGLMPFFQNLGLLLSERPHFHDVVIDMLRVGLSGQNTVIYRPERRGDEYPLGIRMDFAHNKIFLQGKDGKEREFSLNLPPEYRNRIKS